MLSVAHPGRLITATPLMDREDVARLISKYDLLAVPVVDHGRVIGIVTVDDVIDAMVQESTEDVQKFGGIGCSRPRDRWPSAASPVRFSKSKGEPAYGALGGRQVGTLHHLAVGFWCVAGSGETEGVASSVRSCASQARVDRLCRPQRPASSTPTAPRSGCRSRSRFSEIA